MGQEDLNVTNQQRLADWLRMLAHCLPAILAVLAYTGGLFD
jgi:hypothetical protein